MLGEITDKVWKERKEVGQDNQDTGKSIMELLLQAERPGAANTLSQQEIAAEVSYTYNQSLVLSLTMPCR